MTAPEPEPVHVDESLGFPVKIYALGEIPRPDPLDYGRDWLV